MSDLIKDPDTQQLSGLSGQDLTPTSGCTKAKEMDLYNAEKFVVPAREKGKIKKEHMEIVVLNHGETDLEIMICEKVSYPENQEMESLDEENLNILGYVRTRSLGSTVDQLIRSHLFRASGACRWLEKDIVIWVDFELSKIKQSFGVNKEEVPWQMPGSTKYKGNYSCLTTPSTFRSGWGRSEQLDYWGLSPAMQTIVFENDSRLKEVGCYLEDGTNPFLQEDKLPWPGAEVKLRRLVMRYECITTSPAREKLAAYCVI